MASHVAQRLEARGDEYTGTCRVVTGSNPHLIEWSEQSVKQALGYATHLLMSIPPGEGHCEAVAWFKQASKPSLRWLGYLSSTAVYGDHQGNWVDEQTPPNPVDERGKARLEAEQDWLSLYAKAYIFRLAGIYGPHRSAIDQLKGGTARRIGKQGHVFSRIHVADIATLLVKSMDKPQLCGIYNLADEEPCAGHETVAYAAQLLGMTPPPIQAYDEASLSPMMQSFYAASRRINGTKAREAFGVSLAYPTYRQGLKALAEAAQEG